MSENERRKVAKRPSAVMKKELNELQILTLRELEKFGWELKFIRHIEGMPYPVVFDADRKSFGVIESDGRLNEKPGFRIRA